MTRRTKTNIPAFSLLEVVIVVAIMAAVAAIAVPRLASATSHSIVANTQGNITVLERAIETYAAEHDDRTPAHEADGSASADESTFVKRLILSTDAAGAAGDGRRFGPYLRDLPANPKNGRRRIRIDGAPAGANTHGWRFDSVLRIIEPDDAVLSLVFKPGAIKTGDLVGSAVKADEEVAEIIR